MAAVGCARAVRMLCASCAHAVRKLRSCRTEGVILEFFALGFELRAPLREVRRVKMYNTAIDDDALVHLVDWIRRA